MTDKVPADLDAGIHDPRAIPAAHFLYGFGKGLISDVASVGHLVAVNIDDQGVRLHTVAEYTKMWSNLRQGAVYGAQHPGEVWHEVVDENLHPDTWKTDPALAAGETLGGITFTVTTFAIGKAGEATKIAEEGSAAMKAAEAMPAWERNAEMAARVGKSDSLLEFSGVPTKPFDFAAKAYSVGKGLDELGEHQQPGSGSTNDGGFAPGTTQVVETMTHPFALQLEVNVYRPGTDTDQGGDGAPMLHGHVEQTELRTGIEQDQPADPTGSADGSSSRRTETDVHAELYHGSDSNSDLFVQESVRGVVRQHPEATQPPESSVEPLGTTAADGQQPGSSEPAATGSESAGVPSTADESAGGGAPLKGYVERSVELSSPGGGSQPGGESQPGGFAVESVQGVVRQHPEATQPPESSVESLRDAPVGLQAEQGVLTPEMEQEAVAAQSPSGGPSGGAQSSVSPPGSGQEQAGPGDGQQPGSSEPGATGQESAGAQPPESPASTTQASGGQAPDGQSPPDVSSAQSPVLQGHVEESVELSPPGAESQPGGFAVESVQGVVRQHPEATQPPETSVEPLGAAGGDGQQPGSSEPAAPGPESAGAPSTADESAGGAAPLQGYVEKSVDLSPPGRESQPGGESKPGGFAVESVQGVVRQHPEATQPPETSVESLGDAPVGLRAEQGGLTPEMVQEAVAAQSPPQAPSGEAQSSVSPPGSGQEQAGPGDAQQSEPGAATGPAGSDGQSAGTQPVPDAQPSDEQSPSDAPQSPDAQSPPEQSSAPASVLQGHVEESVELSPPDGGSPSGGESQAGGLAVESVQGVVRQHPEATQPPETSVESLGDAPVGLRAEQGGLTPEMVQEAVAAQSPPQAPSGEAQSSVSPPGSGQEQAGLADTQKSETAPATGPESADRHSPDAPAVSDGSSGEPPVLQGHVEESVEQPPSDGESQPTGLVEESVQGVMLQDPAATQPPEISVEPLTPAPGESQPSEADGQTTDAATPGNDQSAGTESQASGSAPDSGPDQTSGLESTPGTIDWLTPGSESGSLFGDGDTSAGSPGDDTGGAQVYKDSEGTHFTLDADGLPQVVDPSQLGDRQAVDIESTDKDLVNDAYKSSATGEVAAAQPIEGDPAAGLGLTSALTTIQSTQIDTQTFEQAASGRSGETFGANESPDTSGGWVDSAAAGTEPTSDAPGGGTTDTTGGAPDTGGGTTDTSGGTTDTSGGTTDSGGSTDTSGGTRDGSGGTTDGGATSDAGASSDTGMSSDAGAQVPDAAPTDNAPADAAPSDPPPEVSSSPPPPPESPPPSE